MPAGERRRRQAAAQIRRLKPEYATYYAARARFHRPTLRRKPVGLREAAAVLRCSTATRPYRPRRPSAPVAFPFAFLRLRSEFPALYERSIIGPATRLSPFWIDRKSTRLNSSHLVISYAVFCLKQHKKHRHHRQRRRARNKYNTSIFEARAH